MKRAKEKKNKTEKLDLDHRKKSEIKKDDQQIKKGKIMFPRLIKTHNNAPIFTIIHIDFTLNYGIFFCSYIYDQSIQNPFAVN